MSLRMIATASRLHDPERNCPLCGRKYGRVEKTEEHIFPLWLQRRHKLLTQTISIPNGITKRYNSVKLGVCKKCNNERFGALERRIASAADAKPGAFRGAESLSDAELAVWLGKIFFLISRKSGMHEDFRLRNAPEKDAILPKELHPGFGFLAVVLNAWALGKGLYSCYLDDPPLPALYGPPFSLYRFRIDTTSTHGTYDYSDNAVGLSAAIRFDDIGLICLFDGGLHKRWLEYRYAFIGNNPLHPVQFRELAALMYYDQSVLDPSACDVQYFWNRSLKSIVAQTLVPRSGNPYMAENHDPERLLACVSHYTGLKADSLRGDTPGEVRSTLVKHDGSFFEYPVTDAEIEALPSDVIHVPPAKRSAGRRPLDDNTQIS